MSMSDFSIYKQHSKYRDSLLDLGISPEYNIGEVSLAALYRQVGWKFISENKKSRYPESQVNIEMKSFAKKINGEKHPKSSFAKEDLMLLINYSLSSPKMPKQNGNAYPILYPYVPDCTLYSGAARLSGNPWNPGSLIESIIYLGCQNDEKANELWSDVFQKLGCDPSNGEEDVLARIVTNEFQLRRTPNIVWEFSEMSRTGQARDEKILEFSPAKAFSDDLSKVLQLKDQLTRRQWLSVLESLIRIGCSAHILWTCNLNIIVWNYLKSRINGEDVTEVSFLTQIQNAHIDLWKLEEKAVPIIKEQIQKFIRAQISINYLIEMFVDFNPSLSLQTLTGIKQFGDLLESNIANNEILRKKLLIDLSKIYEEDPKLMNSTKGITKNIFEFIRYSLGQKQTADSQKRNFDQSYWLKKKGAYTSAPWIFDLGPSSILTMVYCCSFGHEQNRTVNDLMAHLELYGLNISQGEFEASSFLKTLMTLQIIGDSPDAEGGMIIINPFEKVK
jgi:hypothetical protein